MVYFMRKILSNRELPKKTALITGGVAVFFGMLVYGYFDPATVPGFPPCPIYRLTGFQCPGCGTQRALHSLLCLDFKAAWCYNALLLVSLFILALLALAETGKARFPRFHRFFHSRFFAYVCLLLFLCWWVGRNITS